MLFGFGDLERKNIISEIHENLASWVAKSPW
jgi:hypothetical protein